MGIPLPLTPEECASLEVVRLEELKKGDEVWGEKKEPSATGKYVMCMSGPAIFRVIDSVKARCLKCNCEVGLRELAETRTFVRPMTSYK